MKGPLDRGRGRNGVRGRRNSNRCPQSACDSREADGRLGRPSEDLPFAIGSGSWLSHHLPERRALRQLRARGHFMRANLAQVVAQFLQKSFAIFGGQELRIDSRIVRDLIVVLPL